MKPFNVVTGSESGERGKQDFPGKRGFLSLTLAKFSFFIVKSSAKMHPSAHTSIASE